MKPLQILAISIGIVCHLIIADARERNSWQAVRTVGQEKAASQGAHQELPGREKMLATNSAATFSGWSSGSGRSNRIRTRAGETPKQDNLDIMSLIQYLKSLRELVKVNRTALDRFTVTGDTVFYPVPKSDIQKIFRGEWQPVTDLKRVPRSRRDIRIELVDGSSAAMSGENFRTKSDVLFRRNELGGSHGAMFDALDTDDMENSVGRKLNLQDQGKKKNQGSGGIEYFDERGRISSEETDDPDASGYFDSGEEKNNFPAFSGPKGAVLNVREHDIQADHYADRFDYSRYATLDGAGLPSPLIYVEEKWIKNYTGPTSALFRSLREKPHEPPQLRRKKIEGGNVFSGQNIPSNADQNDASRTNLNFQTFRSSTDGEETSPSDPTMSYLNSWTRSSAPSGETGDPYSKVSKKEMLTLNSILSEKASGFSSRDYAGSDPSSAEEDNPAETDAAKQRAKRDTLVQAGPPEDIQYNASSNRLTIVVPVPDMVVTKTELKFDRGSAPAADHPTTAKQPSSRGQIRRALAGIISRIPDPEKIGKALRDRIAEVQAMATSDLRSLLWGGKRYDGHTVAGFQGEFQFPAPFI